MASAVYCSLIKHSKISQSQSSLELFNSFDWLTRRQLSITNWTSAKLSFSSCFREKNERCVHATKQASVTTLHVSVV